LVSASLGIGRPCHGHSTGECPAGMGWSAWRACLPAVMCRGEPASSRGGLPCRPRPATEGQTQDQPVGGGQRSGTEEGVLRAGAGSARTPGRPMSPSPARTGPPWMPSTPPGWPLAAATTALPACVPNITRTITVPSSWTRTATTSRPPATGRLTAAGAADLHGMAQGVRRRGRAAPYRLPALPSRHGAPRLIAWPAGQSHSHSKR
jgi:hypothetical protein